MLLGRRPSCQTLALWQWLKAKSCRLFDQCKKQVSSSSGDADTQRTWCFGSPACLSANEGSLQRATRVVELLCWIEQQLWLRLGRHRETEACDKFLLAISRICLYSTVAAREEKFLRVSSGQKSESVRGAGRTILRDAACRHYSRAKRRDLPRHGTLAGVSTELY